jgi:hypothetical protein
MTNFESAGLVKDLLTTKRFVGNSALLVASRTANLRFETFFHGHVRNFVKGLNRNGVDGLLNLANQTLGNPYLHSPWKKSNRTISAKATGAACLIEGGFGSSPAQLGGHPGDFEVVVLEGKELWLYRHDNSDISKLWERMQLITNQADSPGSIIERVSERTWDIQLKLHPGNFEIVVLQGNDLLHYSRDNANPANPWTAGGSVSNQATGSGCVIESSFISGGRHCLEAVVPEGNKLVHYQCNNIGQQWVRQGDFVTDQATGPGAIIQSSFKSGQHGNFEVVALEGNQLVHYRKDNASNQWHRGAVITDAATSAGWIIESRVQDSQLHGNFEVVVCEGGRLVHFWKDNSDPGSPWRRGQVITTRASGPGSIVHGSFGNIGNFEVVVPENGTLAHYWNVNEGSVGTEGERFYFSNTYQPSKYVDDPYPRHDLDFSYGGAYSLYNWEIFFHAPMVLATRLSKNQRFADAMKWYHYIFDPTDDSQESTTQRYWKVLPLKNVENQRIDRMLGILSDPAKKGSPERQQIEDQLDDWGKHPFQPHRIARLRLVAYQKNVVMKYIDNLIAWGDQLFRRDTIESINEATQLYVLAANLLGQRPETVPMRGKAEPQTYAQLRSKLDSFSNAKQALENEFPFSSAWSSVQVSNETTGLLGIGDSFYFGIPQNDKLLSYWDTVADRLFKIRHCMNIEGVVRQLPLFEPPIDPALLVEAAAKGIDLGSVLADLSAPLPYYRFSYMLQKALEICAELRSLGVASLSAVEKGNAEELATTRATHELDILNRITDIRDQQYKETDEAYNALLKTRDVAVERFKHYQSLLGVQDSKIPAEDAEEAPLVELPGQIKQGADGGLPLLEQEQGELDSLHSARDWQVLTATTEILASVLNYIPNFSLKASPFSVGVDVAFGGQHIGPGMAAVARKQKSLGEQDTYEASHADKIARYTRRQQDWSQQSNLAARDILQINKQLTVANIRRDIADKERKNHAKQIEHAQQVNDFLHNKYTNQELYSWMQGEISAVYFQCYQLAYDFAKKTERAYRFVLGLTESHFIQFGYWDSLRRGLLSGERLYLSLKQMERAYLEQSKREYEITKHVSLMMHDPLALITLKETGQCLLELPEALFDADYPGHYMRRIKSVSLTIPCVVGPYTSINCTLTLLSDKTRIKSSLGAQYAENLDGEDDRFITNFAALQSIATSHAQNDSGMFELNFHDERYLPFEGAGLVSLWRIELPKENNAFDFNKVLRDVVLQFKYTSKPGGDILKNAAQKALKDAQADIENVPLARLFSLKHEFPTEWYRFLNPTDINVTNQTIQMDVAMERFPSQFRGKQIKISHAELFLSFKDDAQNKIYKAGTPLTVTLTAGITDTTGPLSSDPLLRDMPHLSVPLEADVPSMLKLSAAETDVAKLAPSLRQSVQLNGSTHIRLNSDQIEDIILVCHYSVV